MSFRVAFVVVAVLAMFGAVLAFSGRGTWFNVGLGACGGYNNNNQLVAALVREIGTSGHQVYHFIDFVVFLNLFGPMAMEEFVEAFQICVNIFNSDLHSTHKELCAVQQRRVLLQDGQRLGTQRSGASPDRGTRHFHQAVLARHRVLIAVSTPSYFHTGRVPELCLRLARPEPRGLF
jgi:hypothetical protein